MMTTYWVVRSRTHGYLIDTCAGGAFSGVESLGWAHTKVVTEVLTWRNPFDPRAALRDAEIDLSDDLEIIPLDVFM